MARSFFKQDVDFEIPAPMAVCGLLLIAALTKGGHPEWALAALAPFYFLYMATRILRMRAVQIGERSRV